MSTDFSNNATSKYLGYVYQVLIAIEQCLNAAKNITIWLECYGDIYDGSTSTEVKHHFKEKNLSNNSEDFWKTLKNWITEDVSSFRFLVLHTTSKIPDNSIFYNWNELSKQQKYQKLKDHTPTDGIKSYYETVIKQYNTVDLLSILEKVTIRSSQQNVQKKWEELKDDRFFTLIPEEFKEDAIHWIYGYINKQAINDRYSWKIKINDFHKACEIALRQFKGGRIPFPHVRKEEINSKERGFLFVEDMKKIELEEDSIEKAVSDYLRAKRSEIKLLEYEPTSMSNHLEEYDEEVLDSLKSMKISFYEEIKNEWSNISNIYQISRKLFHESLRSQYINIRNVDDTQKYYRDGRIHHNVNEKLFSWIFDKEKL